MSSVAARRGGALAGGVGCISATANVNPDGIDGLYRNWQSPEADEIQAGLNAVRQTLQRHPMIAAMKATTAHYTGHDGWRRVRPPLVPLSDADAGSVVSDLKQVGFTMNIDRGWTSGS